MEVLASVALDCSSLVPESASPASTRKQARFSFKMLGGSLYAVTRDRGARRVRTEEEGVRVGVGVRHSKTGDEVIYGSVGVRGVGLLFFGAGVGVNRLSLKAGEG